MNEGTGYRTSEGQISYCYDHDAHGPGRSGQEYTDLRETTYEEDYLLAKGYPATNQIGGSEWSDAEAQAVTQMFVWLASGTASEADFADADPAMVAAARELADEAVAYKGGDASIDECDTVCTVAGKPVVQSMLTVSGGGHIRLAKASADKSVTEGDGDYSLEGAVYGVYQGDELVAHITTGEDGHGSTDARVPDGTYTVREIEAPAGYVLSNEEYEVTVFGHDAVVDAADMPVTVAFRLKKTDAETGEATPQGAASLDGAVYEASFEQNGKTKTVRGTTKEGEVTFEGIPLGRISACEVTPPTGYLSDTEEHIFMVMAEDAGHGSAVLELTPEGEFTEQVVRGDLALMKVADGTQQRLAGVPFKITSKTTGESHVIVTDGNGQASTAASWNAHTKDTNGGTADSGVWFGGFEPDDAKGALPYDTYTVEELPCEANADRTLILTFDVSVYCDAVTVDLGTLTNDAPPAETPPAPAVRTEATNAEDGDHEAVADDSVTIVDTVSYTGLTPGKEYTLTGTLVDKETGEPVRSDGKAVTSTVAFVPDAADGTQEVIFTFDGAKLSGYAVVAFESLTLEGQEVASHADMNDEGQTVKLVPPETPETPEAPTPGGKLPQTGDELPIAGICVLAAAGCAASVIGIARSIGPHRKEDEGEED
ncbi:MAG: hypothetical protein DUD39_08110 [Coriobacteriaceae bacterium]|nr:MAG: hypothetical protein DUD39_08110 [Coriobacteriaceae bacterium]